MSRLLDSLASLYMDFGARYTRAERFRRRALELRVAEVGPDGPGVGVLLSNLAAACMALRRFDEASRLFDRALEVLGRNEYGQDPAVASVLQNLGALAGAMGRHTDAEHYLMRSVAVLEKAQGVDHPDLVRPLVNLSSVRLLRKDFSAAEAALLRAHRIVETRLGAEHPLMIGVLMIYQDLLRRTKQKAEADEVKRRISALMDLHPDVRAANVKVDVLDLARVAEPRGKPSTKR